MNIPRMRNTHDAIKFARKHYGNKEALASLKDKKREIDARNDKYFDEFKRTGKFKKSFHRLVMFGSACREAVEMMEKRGNWAKQMKGIW